MRRRWPRIQRLNGKMLHRASKKQQSRNLSWALAWCRKRDSRQEGLLEPLLARRC
jgi:hypothetical protein